jgi:hypothetical protein
LDFSEDREDLKGREGLLAGSVYEDVEDVESRFENGFLVGDLPLVDFVGDEGSDRCVADSRRCSSCGGERGNVRLVLSDVPFGLPVKEDAESLRECFVGDEDFLLLLLPPKNFIGTAAGCRGGHPRLTGGYWFRDPTEGYARYGTRGAIAQTGRRRRLFAKGGTPAMMMQEYKQKSEEIVSVRYTRLLKRSR